MKLSIEKKIAINFGAALAVLLLIAAGAAWNAHRFAATFASVDHTHQVLGDIWEIQAGIYQMQSGARGFVLTGDDHLLMPYFQSQKAIAAAVVELRKLVRDMNGRITHDRDEVGGWTHFRLHLPVAPADCARLVGAQEREA